MILRVSTFGLILFHDLLTSPAIYVLAYTAVLCCGPGLHCAVKCIHLALLCFAAVYCTVLCLLCSALPCPTLLCPTLLIPALLCSSILCLALPCPVLPFPALPCPALLCSSMLCPALPCPALTCPALPCHESSHEAANNVGQRTPEKACEATPFRRLVRMSFCYDVLLLCAAMACVVCAGLVLPRLPKAALPLAVGTVGALIMPHNMYLQSAVVQSRSVSHTHTPNWHSLPHSLTCSLTHSRTHSLPPSFTRSLARSRTRSLARSLTHSLPRSLTQSLPHSRTHSLIHACTHALTHSQVCFDRHSSSRLACIASRPDLRTYLTNKGISHSQILHAVAQ